MGFFKVLSRRHKIVSDPRHSTVCSNFQLNCHAEFKGFTQIEFTYNLFSQMRRYFESIQMPCMVATSVFPAHGKERKEDHEFCRSLSSDSLSQNSNNK